MYELVRDPDGNAGTSVCSVRLVPGVRGSGEGGVVFEADGGAGGVGVGACVVSQGSVGTPESTAGGAGVVYGSGAGGNATFCSRFAFAHDMSRTIQAASEAAMFAPSARSPGGTHAAEKS